MTAGLLIALFGLGLVAGSVGTLVGAGGGFLLMPILLLGFPDRLPVQLTAISLFVVFCNATSGSLAYRRMKLIDTWSAVRFALAGLPGMVLGVLIVEHVDTRLFAQIFAVVLAIYATVILVVGHRPRPVPTISSSDGRLVCRTIVDACGQSHIYQYRLWIGLASTAVVGLVSGVLGLGGGIMHVPIFILLLGFPPHVATATSHLILAITSLFSVVLYAVRGELDGSVPIACVLAVGAILGARAGAYLSQRVHGTLILRLLAIALFVVAARLMFR